MLYGIVTSTGRGDGYAFAQVTGDQRGYFIHATHVAPPLVMGALRVGDHIMFDVRMTAKGPCAIGVRRALVTGVIVSLFAERGYAFAAPGDGGPHRFVHAARLAPGVAWAALHVGARVSYYEEPGWPGQAKWAADLRPTSDNNGVESKRSTTVATGTITGVVSSRGFAFIEPDDGGEDLFVHATALRNVDIRDLTRGARVAYTVSDRPTTKGPRAVDVELVGQEQASTVWPASNGAALDGDADDQENSYDWGQSA